MSWYKTGTVTVTNGNPVVTGAGTLFVDAGVLNPGDIFTGPDAKLYEILSIQSNTQLTLASNYLGGTLAGQAYAILPIGLLPSALAQQVKSVLTTANTALASAVRFDTAAQGLTTEQQGNARTNIAALGAADVGAGRLAKSVAGNVDVNLTATEAANQFLEFTGVLTGNINVIVPTAARLWFAFNNTSGAYTLTVKTAAGTGVAIAQGKKTVIECDATNVIFPVDWASTWTVSGAFSAGATTAATLNVAPGVAGTTVATFTGTYNAAGSVILGQWNRAGGTVGHMLRYNDSVSRMGFGSSTNHAWDALVNGTSVARFSASGADTENSTNAGAALQINESADKLAHLILSSARSDGSGNRIGAIDFDFPTNSATYRNRARIECFTIGATANQRGGQVMISAAGNGVTTPATVVIFDATGEALTGLLDISAASSGQIKFPATQNASSDANTYDDYEEGSATLAVRGSGTAGTYEIATQWTSYTKKGREVTLNFYIAMAGSITGGGTGDLQITGAPFTKRANTVPIGTAFTSGVDLPAGTAGLISTFSTGGTSTTILLTSIVDNAAEANVPISGVSANDYFSGTITYEV